MSSFPDSGSPPGGDRGGGSPRKQPIKTYSSNARTKRRSTRIDLTMSSEDEAIILPRSATSRSTPYPLTPLARAAARSARGASSSSGAARNPAVDGVAGPSGLTAPPHYDALPGPAMPPDGEVFGIATLGPAPATNIVAGLPTPAPLPAAIVQPVGVVAGTPLQVDIETVVRLQAKINQLSTELVQRDLVKRALDDVLACHVCLRQLHQPLVLPDCGHSFCAECLIRLLRNKKEQFEQETGGPFVPITPHYRRLLATALSRGARELVLRAAEVEHRGKRKPVVKCPTCRGKIKKAPIPNYPLQQVIELTQFPDDETPGPDVQPREVLTAQALDTEWGQHFMNLESDD